MVAPVVFSSGCKVAFVAAWKVSCGELRHCFTRCTNPKLSQLVAKCEQILCKTSCEFIERVREAKICCESRPAHYYSQQQVDRARLKARNISQVESFCIEYIVAAFKVPRKRNFCLLFYSKILKSMISCEVGQFESKCATFRARSKYGNLFSTVDLKRCVKFSSHHGI